MEKFLAEHLGYPVLSLLDDIINAVNDILYKCMSQIETVLKDVSGTATLESLMEHTVNKYFDMFEVYSMRNVFNLAGLEEYVRLPYQEGLELKNVEEKSSQLDSQLEECYRQLQYETERSKYLKEENERIQRLKMMMSDVLMAKDQFENYNSNMAPLQDSVTFIMNQLQDMQSKLKENTLNSVN
ncbi:hypothetical protein CANINC_003221 [Pichia inconspicua]|uniref:Protein MIS12 homolog n=1 Tax=Pichia inconspicua TaxID=52247 RepID=A0A4V4NFI5_9ASCO|nr:hypothetical protein CANINC_003221 [[Candida] inconspicua]